MYCVIPEGLMYWLLRCRKHIYWTALKTHPQKMFGFRKEIQVFCVNSNRWMIDNDNKQKKKHILWLVLIHLHMKDTWGHNKKFIACMIIMCSNTSHIMSSRQHKSASSVVFHSCCSAFSSYLRLFICERLKCVDQCNPKDALLAINQLTRVIPKMLYWR